jgi:hypothetical protein
MIKFQINDCGLLLATSPASWKFKGISGEESQRISVVLSFKYMTPPAMYDIFVPAHHADMVRKLYANLGATHNFLVPSESQMKFSREESVLKTGVNDLESCAEIFVAEYGSDIIHQLRKTLRGFCVEQIAATNLFLKLKDPLTYKLTAGFEKMGFFFAGILPESRIGDALMLQYLNNVDLDYSKIQLVSDVSKELLTYIRKHDPNIFD